MKSYPYIGQCYNAIVLFYTEGEGLVLEDDLDLDDNTKVGDKVTLHGGAFKNITHEYLANTYGEVVSPEHAEFIVELAENSEFKFVDVGNEKKFFYFNSSEILFTKFKRFIPEVGNRKQITIPLPPKIEPLKNAGDNLVLGCEDSIDNLCDRVAESILKKNPTRSGCEDSKCDGWPQVGDEVQTSMGKGNVELLPDSVGNYIVEINGVFFPMLIDELQKPRTPEGELRDEIGVYLCEKYNFITGAESLEITDTLLMKYNITKKPQ